MTRTVQEFDRPPPFDPMIIMPHPHPALPPATPVLRTVEQIIEEIAAIKVRDEALGVPPDRVVLPAGSGLAGWLFWFGPAYERANPDIRLRSNICVGDDGTSAMLADGECLDDAMCLDGPFDDDVIKRIALSVRRETS